MTEASVAIYWDFENIHASVMTAKMGGDWFNQLKDKKIHIQDTKVLDIAAIMQYANTLGEVVINRAYANWSNFWPYTELVNGYSMDLVQLFPLGKNAKNGADIRLSLDIAEDLVAHSHIDIVLLVSGDSDFIAIAQRVRRKHKRIIGLGVEKTSNRYWQMACNEFKLYHTIVAQYGAAAEEEAEEEIAYVLAESQPKKKAGARSAAASAKTKSAKSDAEAPVLKRAKAAPEKVLLVQALQSLEAREGKPWVMRVKIKPMMLRLDPAFDEANFGYSNFTDFLEGNADIVELRPTETDTLVRVKTTMRTTRRGLRAAQKAT